MKGIEMKQKIKLLATVLFCLVIIFSISCSFFEAPDTPSGLTAVYNETTDAVELKWDDVDGANNYKVYRGADDNSLDQIESTSHSSYDDYDYSYYERYYSIEAENSFGSSDLCEAIEANVPSTDKYEPDNTMETASTLTLESDAPSQKHSIMPVGDVDYIKFYADPTYGYNIEIPAASAIPVKITLLDAYGNFLGSDSEGAGDYIARIGEWQPTTAGWYYIRIEAKTASGEGYYRIFVHQWT